MAGMPLISEELRIESFELWNAEKPAVPTVTCTILIHGLPVRFLFDMGATHSFKSDACVERMSLVTTEGTPFSIGLPNGSRVIGTHEIFVCPICVGTCVVFVDLFVMPLVHGYVVLGMDSMDRHQAVRDVGRRTVTVSTELGQIEVFRG